VKADRLTPRQLEEHLELVTPWVRAIALALREAVLAAAPEAAEAVRFGCLAYFYSDARYGAIGGNICMIETARGAVRLSFIHGSSLPDPERLLQGRARFKRFVPVESVAEAQDERLAALIRASAGARSSLARANCGETECHWPFLTAGFM
jgi:hypothetical protein